MSAGPSTPLTGQSEPVGPARPADAETRPAPAANGQPGPVPPADDQPVDRRQGIGRLIGVLVRDRRIRYLAVGGVAAAVYYLYFSAGWLLSSGRIPYLVMVVIANLLCAVTTYPLYRIGVFQTRGPWVSGFLRFYVVCLWALAFAFVGLPLLVEIVHIPVLIALPIIIIVSPIINYQISKYWAFRHR